MICSVNRDFRPHLLFETNCSNDTRIWTPVIRRNGFSSGRSPVVIGGGDAAEVGAVGDAEVVFVGGAVGLVPGVGAVRDGDRTGDDGGGGEDFLEGGDGAVGDGDGLGGEGVAGAVGSEGEGVDAVLQGDIAEIFAIQERAAGGGVVDFDLHGAHPVDGVAVLVGEDTLVVNFCGRSIGSYCKREQRGGEKGGCLHF